LKDIATQQVQVAGARWEIIKLYLIINYQIFTEWRKSIFDNNVSLSQKNFKNLEKI
jgi:hypothetical protein